MDQQIRQAMFTIFDRLQKNTIQLSYAQTDNPIGIGQSKIGGKPDLPQDFVWPYYEGRSYENITAKRPLAFLAQINLAQAAVYDKENLLPREGVLSFFYEMETEKWGFDPHDSGCAKVFYFKTEDRLNQRELPGDLLPCYHFPEFSISFAAAAGLPSYEDFEEALAENSISAQLLSEIDKCGRDDFWDSYDELRQEYGCVLDGDWSANTKLLGYPDVIQNSMQRECEEVTRGIYNGKASEIPAEFARDIKRESHNWTLLFQMGTIENDDFELMFGDVGHIYFWIKKQDLAAKNFETAWLILQCS